MSIVRRPLVASILLAVTVAACSPSDDGGSSGDGAAAPGASAQTDASPGTDDGAGPPPAAGTDADGDDDPAPPGTDADADTSAEPDPVADPACQYLDEVVELYADAILAPVAAAPDVAGLAAAYDALATTTGSGELADRALYAQRLTDELTSAGLEVGGGVILQEDVIEELGSAAPAAWSALARLSVPAHFSPLVPPTARTALRSLACDFTEVPFTLARLTTEATDIDDAVSRLPDLAAWLAPVFIDEDGEVAPTEASDRCAELGAEVAAVPDGSTSIAGTTNRDHDIVFGPVGDRVGRSLSCTSDGVGIDVVVGDITEPRRLAVAAAETVEAGDLTVRLARPAAEDNGAWVAVAIDARPLPAAVVVTTDDETRAVANLAETVDRLEASVATLDQAEPRRLMAPRWPDPADADLDTGTITDDSSSVGR